MSHSFWLSLAGSYPVAQMLGIINLNNFIVRDFFQKLVKNYASNILLMLKICKDDPLPERSN